MEEEEGAKENTYGCRKPALRETLLARNCSKEMEEKLFCVTMSEIMSCCETQFKVPDEVPIRYHVIFHQLYLRFSRYLIPAENRTSLFFLVAHAQ